MEHGSKLHHAANPIPAPKPAPVRRPADLYSRRQGFSGTSKQVRCKGLAQHRGRQSARVLRRQLLTRLPAHLFDHCPSPFVAGGISSDVRFRLLLCK